ncbi:MAG TPA: hypothetical protein VGM67_16425 [Gemmatimonadaceae bacterium]|jgi:hypothetical protein
MVDHDPRLTDEDAQKVIARALELQTQSVGALTVMQVREIAAELLIPESAVDQALAEYRAAAAEGTAATATGGVTSAWRGPLRVKGMLAVVGGAFVLLMVITVISRLFP